MEKIVQRRLRRREEAIREAVEFVKCVAQVLDVVAAWLFGSYARGDFNEWSDIDVLIVVRGVLPRRPADRLGLVEVCLETHRHVEPVIVTVEEYEKMLQKRNPIVIDVEQHGIDLLTLVKQEEGGSEHEQLDCEVGLPPA